EPFSGPKGHRPAPGELPYRPAPARHRRGGHGGDRAPARGQRGSGQDALAPRPPGATDLARPPRPGRAAMNCQTFIEFLMEYLGGALSCPERATFEEHLRECEECVAYLRQYEETVKLGKGCFRCQGEALPAGVPEELVRAILAARQQRP